jgi:hypothetical protein
MPLQHRAPGRDGGQYCPIAGRFSSLIERGATAGGELEDRLRARRAASAEGAPALDVLDPRGNETTINADGMLSTVGLLRSRREGCSSRFLPPPTPWQLGT